MVFDETSWNVKRLNYFPIQLCPSWLSWAVEHNVIRLEDAIVSPFSLSWNLCHRCAGVTETLKDKWSHLLCPLFFFLFFKSSQQWPFSLSVWPLQIMMIVSIIFSNSISGGKKGKKRTFWSSCVFVPLAAGHAIINKTIWTPKAIADADVRLFVWFIVVVLSPLFHY